MKLKVLHYKSNFLNYSETFIHRIIAHHRKFEAAAMCLDKRQFTDGLELYEQPKRGLQGLINTVYFHLNGCLPFYNRTLQKVQPDLIHAHFGYDGWRMIKPALQNDLPLVTGFYGSDVSRLPTEFDWPRRYRKLARHGDAFIAISSHMKTQLIKLGFPESDIHIIPFGLDAESFPSGGSPDPHSLMMVGRMVEKKGFRYALEAVKILKNEDIPVHLDLYGDGPLEKQLKSLARKWDIQSRVAFHGYTPVEQIKQEHPRHGMLLAPSVTAADGDEEGLPNTILEAMASGTLAIASDHAAIDEALTQNETGLLAPEGDAKALAEKIRFALNNRPRVEQIEQNARSLIKEKYEIDAVVEKTEALYRQTIQRHKQKVL